MNSTTLSPRTRGPRALASLFMVAALGVTVTPAGCYQPSAPMEDEDDVAAAQQAAVTNLALGKPTSQSSTYAGSLASARSSSAVDGNTDGNFQAGSVTHTNNDAQAWWEVDLLRVEEVGTVVVWNRTDAVPERLSNFKLLVSNDHVDWQPYAYADPAPPQLAFAVNRPARWVRVQLVGQNYLSLAEVQVFPRQPPGARNIAIDHSGKCLDVSGAGLANGDKVIQWDCGPQPNQWFTLDPRAGGAYAIRVAHSAKCLDVNGPDRGAAVTQWDCADVPHQKFVPELFSDGTFALHATHSNLCLDINGGGTESGATLIQWTCHGGPNQRFRLPGRGPLVYGQTYRLLNGASTWGGGYLDTRDAGCQGNKLCVSTATTHDREAGSGVWRLRSAEGRSAGEMVRPGDRVYLENLKQGQGGYLDTRGAGCQGGQLCVSTAESFDRDNSSGTWVIETPSGVTTALVWDTQAVRLRNLYNGGNGGYLQTLNAGCQGNQLCVSTGASAGAAAADWRLEAVPMPVFYGMTYHLRSTAFDTATANGNGGYLDTREAGCQGNKYCVSTAAIADRAGTTSAWRIESTQGKPSGAVVEPHDLVRLVNLYQGNGGYLDLRSDGSVFRASTSATWQAHSGTWQIYGTGVNSARQVYLRNNPTGLDGGHLNVSGDGCQGNVHCVSSQPGQGASTGWKLEAVEAQPVPELVKRFAPQLRFDGASNEYPTSAETYYRTDIQRGISVRNRDYGSVEGHRVPTYYQMTMCGTQVRIKYWFFYGGQDDCIAGSGAHRGDWESVMVTANADGSQIAAVTYWIHGDHYTRIRARGGVEIVDATHAVVYVGKTQHGSYYNQGGLGGCGVLYDYRNNTDGRHMDTWTNLVSLDALAEPWMAYDRIGGGLDWGIDSHPHRAPPSCSENACDWGDLWGNEGAMRYCQCKHGDTDTGVQCWDGGSSYGYDYEIPTTDDGL